jgi:hypothetical protein
VHQRKKENLNSQKEKTKRPTKELYQTADFLSTQKKIVTKPFSTIFKVLRENEHAPIIL